MMQPKITSYVDKSSWGAGPWQAEPDRVEWRHQGVPCLLVRNDELGNWCGYAGCPPGHPFHGAPIEALQYAVSVHGHVTFASPCDEDGKICHVPEPGEPAEVYWIGFDCGHGGLDGMPGLLAKFNSFTQHSGMRKLLADERYRDLAYVTAEVERLAEQIAQAAS